MLNRLAQTRWRYVISTLVVAAGLSSLASTALAAHATRIVTLAQDQTISHDYFAAGSLVEVDGTVHGDVYAVGGQVVINGTIDGDVLAAGGTVTVDGVVNGNVRVAGGNLLIDGHVTKSVSVVGGNVELTHNAVIDGSIAAATGNLQDSGSIAGDMNAALGQLVIGSDAHVGGAITYWSNNNASIGAGAVSGTITHDIPPMHHPTGPQGPFGLFFMALYWLILLYLLAALLSWWLPNHSKAVAQTVRHHPWQSLGLGFLAAIVIPITGIILIITLIGIPFALSLWALYAVALLLAPVWFVLVLREMLTSRWLGVHAMIVLLIAAFIYVLLTLVPFLGALFLVVTILTGLGASLAAGYRTHQRLRNKNEI